MLKPVYNNRSRSWLFSPFNSHETGAKAVKPFQIDTENSKSNKFYIIYVRALDGVFPERGVKFSVPRNGKNKNDNNHAPERRFTTITALARETKGLRFTRRVNTESNRCYSDTDGTKLFIALRVDVIDLIKRSFRFLFVTGLWNV